MENQPLSQTDTVSWPYNRSRSFQEIHSQNEIIFFWVWVEQFSQKKSKILDRMRQKSQILMKRTSDLSKQPILVSGI